MFEVIGFLIALIGSSLAAAFDVKITPTEIPDKIPHSMIVLALILVCVECVLNSNFNPLTESLFYGFSLLAFGFLLYKLGQWGGGDAKVLAAVGFFSPLISPLTKNVLFPFAFSYLLNVFIIGALYMLLHAFVLAMRNKKILSEFLKKTKASSKIMFFSLFILFSVFSLGNFYLFQLFSLPLNFNSVLCNSFILSIISFCLFLLWLFVKSVEDVEFKRRIPVSKLKIGDVLLESKVWEGITEKELKKIKKSGKKFVWIKEGVKFAPTFPLALIFTLLWGDKFFFLFNFV